MWFRRDLRLDDNSALAAALEQSREIACVFVFDTDILDALEDRADRRVEFIYQSVTELAERIGALGGTLLVSHGSAREHIPRVAASVGAQAVFANRDYEPQACERDDAVRAQLARDERAFELFKDTVIFERDEILAASGTPYTVFTPYWKSWQRALEPGHYLSRNSEDDLRGRLARIDDRVAGAHRLSTLEQIGFEPTDLAAIGAHGGASHGHRLFEDFRARIGRYRDARDYPAVKGPSYLSPHLRFGTVSVRSLVHFAARVRVTEPDCADGATTWLSELAWREFYFQLLHHHPRVVSACFRSEFDRLRWNDDPAALRAWQDARTGYPLVDAAMRQLNRTGYMHNRLRMITASFLTKDLGIDWRRGEAYFARKLLDYDLAANNGGWQWAASTGCDAQPWFRIFNPVTQSQRFDPEGKFIRRYVPELAGLDAKDIHAPWLAAPLRLAAAGVRLGADYPEPIVDHAQARQATLARFGAVKGS